MPGFYVQEFALGQMISLHTYDGELGRYRYIRLYQASSSFVKTGPVAMVNDQHLRDRCGFILLLRALALLHRRGFGYSADRLQTRGRLGGWRYVLYLN